MSDAAHRDTGMHEAGIRDSGRDDDANGWNLPPPTYAPTFRAIYTEIFDYRGCTSVFCHGAGGSSLDFVSIDTAYDALIDREPRGALCVNRGLVLVVPNEPDRSLFYAKVSSDTPPCGERMPRVPGITLNRREIAQVRAWIAAGAPKD